jgi:hypothetical protein
MKTFLLCVFAAFLCTLYSCEKNSCQTGIQGQWLMLHPIDTTFAIDSVIFYNADSIRETYKLKSGTDTTFHNYYTSYFINDYCNEIDFNGSNSWNKTSGRVRYSITALTATDFQFRSMIDSLPSDTVLIRLHKEH